MGKQSETVPSFFFAQASMSPPCHNLGEEVVRLEFGDTDSTAFELRQGETLTGNNRFTLIITDVRRLSRHHF